MIDLYSAQILALAADIPHLGRLDAPMRSAEKRAPLCGSKICVDLDVVAGKVTRFAQDVQACALGQAAAALLGRSVIGAAPAQVLAARDALAAMLAGGDAPPAPPFFGLDVLKVAVPYTNRHASILLAFDATLAALEQR